MPKIAILRGVTFGRAKTKKSRKSKSRAQKSHKKARGGQAAQRNRFKAAATECKSEVVAQIRKTTGAANPFKMIGACMRRHLKKK